MRASSWVAFIEQGDASRGAGVEAAIGAIEAGAEEAAIGAAIDEAIGVYFVTAQGEDFEGEDLEADDAANERDAKDERDDDALAVGSASGAFASAAEPHADFSNSGTLAADAGDQD